MKNSSITKGILTIGILSLLTSCYVGRSTYTNATMGSTNSYVVKPEYKGQNESAIYVSGEFGNSNVSNQDGSQDSNSKIAGGFNIHRAHTNKHFNAYYGVGAQFGTFKFPVESFQIDNSEELISAGNKNFYAFQTKAGINYLVSKPYADFRILGIDFGHTYEFGPYSETLKEIEAENIEILTFSDEVEVFQKSSVFYLGLSSEVLFKINTNNSIGINPFAGKSFLESKKGIAPNLYGLTLSYRCSDFTFNFFNEINSQYGVDAYSCKLGLSYRIN